MPASEDFFGDVPLSRVTFATLASDIYSTLTLTPQSRRIKIVFARDMDRTKEFTDFILSHVFDEDNNTKPHPRKSLVRDIHDEYTQEAYRIVFTPY